MASKTHFLSSDTKFLVWTLGGILLTLSGVIAFAGMGYIDIPFFDVCKIMIGSKENVIGSTEWFVVHDIRLPRILTAILTGVALSLSGLVFQGVLLNPLADPYTLGISSGASFGAALALLLGLSGVMIQGSAFFFAIISLGIVLRLATFEGRIIPVSLILSGVIIGAFFSAGLSFSKYLAGDEIASIFFWLLGSFQGKTWMEVMILLAVVSFGSMVIYFYAEEINILSLGEKNASSMGVDTHRVRLILLVVASLMSSVTVSICGIIGFVGLIIPHMMRFLVGTDNKKLIIVCSLWGGILLSMADNVSRALLPHEVPIGILTALLGAPFFAIVFRNKMRGKKR
ncbi:MULTISPECIES: FecCD family ABC transporter permease [Sulfurospirillum]|uniref:Corrinoid ABC transporter, permease component BtuC n=2 Tax=Sulfurospirillum TaxID=57665 RepID=A0A290HPI2_9BACT|nr:MULTISPECIES: iron ABC transporter permease [Sulfurospirillum]ASC93594.1 corrinoid ABC transporter, permease component BtuC [Sulfurospirillum diekertiae]ATB69638.1 corrinoid ABC transporter, permease component BtuC [Sulfurospirillum diekertiae]QEH06307.1 corrinoid ABC transporter, permease component BtuC [Sulfurospirillum multivorans]